MVDHREQGSKKRKLVLYLLLVAVLGISVVAYWLPWFYRDPVQDSIDAIPGYSGAEMNAILAELGKPTHQYNLTVADCADEFRIQILNYYPPTNSLNAPVPIKEMTWQYQDAFLTIWFHKKGDKWVPLDSRRWHKSMRF